ncbi:MAG TPA: aspartyl protease family protein [Acidimicrobiales bacterium]|nr:aspartyl protease family protein [Acidimicrobiales bacterium]
MDARRSRRGGVERVSAAAIALLLGVSLAACGGGDGGPASAARVHVEPEVNFALPTAADGCSASTALPGGGTHVPIEVSTVAGQVAELVNICISGQGPFPFVLDSGAGQSTIDADLARRLHLPSAGPPTLFSGVNCTGKERPVSVGQWSLEGVGLAPQTLTSATLPQMGGKGEPVGLLGSDVLARFGAVRIDFAGGDLVLPGPQGPPLPSESSYTGPVGPAPAAALTQGAGTTVPVTVSPLPGDVSLSVPVRFEGGPRRSFIVDTGSSQSVVSTSVSQAESLSPTKLAQRQATVCSVITVPLVHSGQWALPGQSLFPQLVGSTDFGTIALGGTQGLLGSDQLKRFGWVVLDYAGGRMVLG